MYVTTAQQGKRARVQALATELYESDYFWLRSIAVRNAVTAADAEEALQEAFITFIEQYDPDSTAPPLAWLTLTLKRLCWSKTKRDRRQVLFDSLPSSDAHDVCTWLEHVLQAKASDTAERVEERQEARRALASLKSDERRALGLLALGYSYREICQLIGWTYTKVNRCLAEGRVALRRSA